MRKPDFASVKTKVLISCAVTAQLISAFVFPTWIVQSLLFLNPKFQASSLYLRLYRPVYVRPGLKPRNPVSLHHSSYEVLQRNEHKMSHVMTKPTMWFPTMSNIN